MIHNTARLPLPALVSAGAAGDLRSGKQLIGADGSIVTGTMPEVAGKTITPGTTAQTAVAAGRYVTGDVVVAGDANLVPENIAEGVSIFGVSGTHKGGADTVTGTLVVPSSASTGGMYVQWIDDYGVHDTLCERGSSVTITPFSNSFIFGPTATIASGDAEKMTATGFQTGLCYVYGDFTLTYSP